jgi:tetratricopeptide (TPR) repeat protein
MPGASQSAAEQSAFSLEHEGKTAEAEQAWAAIAKARPSDSMAWAHLGLLAARQAHFAQAIASYRKALVLNPAMPGLRLNLGLAYFKDGQYRQAIQVFSELLKAPSISSDDSQRLNVLIGMSHYGLAEYAAATPFLKQASGHDATNLPLLLTLAHSCLLSRQYQCVLDTYHQIIALNPNSAEADMLVGEALDEMKDTVGAVREFRSAVAANPKEPNVHFGLGYLLWTQGQTQEAADQFKAELENDQGNLQAMLYLADSYMQLNRKQDAEPLLERLVKSDPKSSMAHLDLGVIYADSGRNATALNEFKTAVALKPEDVNAHYRLARLYRAMGKTDDARAEFEKTKKLNESANEGLLKVMSRVPHAGAPPAAPAAAADK